MWISIGVVTKPADAERFEVLTDDVTVEVILQPSLQDVTCRLAAAIWNVPNEGEEVVVVLAEGVLDFMPVVIAVLSTGSVPTTQGPAANRIVIQRGEVIIHDGAGGAAALALASELSALRTYVVNQFSATLGHTHTVAGTTTTAIVTVTAPGAPPTVIPSLITGTTCLKAK